MKERASLLRDGVDLCIHTEFEGITTGKDDIDRCLVVADRDETLVLLSFESFQ